MLIISPKYGAIELVPLIPDTIPGLLLPGSDTQFCEREFGTILIQEYNGEHYSLRYSIFNFFKKMTLLFKEGRTGIRSQLALKGGLKVKPGRKGKLNLKEGQFFLFIDKNEHRTISFETGKEYRVFDTYYSVELLNELLESFPSLKDFINSSTSRRSTPRAYQKFASPKMIEIVYDILKCPYDEKLRRMYFENKVRDFLIELLIQAFRTTPAEQEFSLAETEAVYRARDIILTDLKQHFTIREISQNVRLNKLKLKEGFKKQFGTGLFEFLLQARMQKARDLLIETDKPIKEIALLTGYERITSFITAFRRYFGYTPGSLRRK